MALCSNSGSLVVSQQLRVCDARDDAGSAVQKSLGKARTTHLRVGRGELCPKFNLTTFHPVCLGARLRCGTRARGDVPSAPCEQSSAQESTRHTLASTRPERRLSKHDNISPSYVSIPQKAVPPAEAVLNRHQATPRIQPSVLANSCMLGSRSG